MKISILDNNRCHLAEGPVWDESEQALYWVDSLGPTIFRHDWDLRCTERWLAPGKTIGSLAVGAGGGLVVAMDTGLFTVDLRSQSWSTIAEPLAGINNSHFNDGKVDRAGNFVAGGVYGNEGSDISPRPLCPMVHLDSDHGVRVLMNQFLCFNGPCFSPDGSILYVNGRGDMRHIEALPYDQENGSVAEASGRILISDISPDGATVDAEGRLLSAQWDDGCVLAISNDGSITDRIDLPGQVVSSVMFGGPDLNILFVTTLGKPHWGTTPVAENAGAVFIVEGSGYRGLAEQRYAG
jgi:L-arabinonolactonase